MTPLRGQDRDEAGDRECRDPHQELKLGEAVRVTTQPRPLASLLELSATRRSRARRRSASARAIARRHRSHRSVRAAASSTHHSPSRLDEGVSTDAASSLMTMSFPASRRVRHRPSGRRSPTRGAPRTVRFTTEWRARRSRGHGVLRRERRCSELKTRIRRDRAQEERDPDGPRSTANVISTASRLAELELDAADGETVSVGEHDPATRRPSRTCRSCSEVIERVAPEGRRSRVLSRHPPSSR